jgi:hypothetical protein
MSDYNDIEWDKVSGGTLPEIKKEGNIRLPNGCTLYWKETEQGREYFSDEVGGGVNVWHTALVDQSTLLAAITQENAILKLEYYKRDREKERMIMLIRQNNGRCPYCSTNPINKNDFCDFHRSQYN